MSVYKPQCRSSSWSVFLYFSRRKKVEVIICKGWEKVKPNQLRTSRFTTHLSLEILHIYVNYNLIFYWRTQGMNGLFVYGFILFFTYMEDLRKNLMIMRMLIEIQRNHSKYFIPQANLYNELFSQHKQITDVLPRTGGFKAISGWPSPPLQPQQPYNNKAATLGFANERQKNKIPKSFIKETKISF